MMKTSNSPVGSLHVFLGYSVCWIQLNLCLAIFASESAYSQDSELSLLVLLVIFIRFKSATHGTPSGGQRERTGRGEESSSWSASLVLAQLLVIFIRFKSATHGTPSGG